VVSVYEGSDFVKSADVTLAAATGAATFTLAADYKYATAYTLRVVTGNADYDGVPTASSAVTSPAAPVTPGKAGSGGGCDAGFGLFGLLAATGAVALLRRKG
jgi:Synergist-CTERM protein sorting domain-containing protein